MADIPDKSTEADSPAVVGVICGVPRYLIRRARAMMGKKTKIRTDVYSAQELAA